MKSLYRELSDKIAEDPRMNANRGPRQDLGILLFSRREEIAALWSAAERSLVSGVARSENDRGDLSAAVESLRHLFGERP
jgi:hypothetical protein